MTKHKIHYVNPVNLIYVYLRIKLFVEYLFKFVNPVNLIYVYLRIKLFVEYLFKFVKYVFENIKEVLRRD
ncbi:hypothetical protein [Staphylococcus felis]|uniref:hypothetical protein n=1 Tax=Staphylococcus felis TaxID=46127 RepID=UPI003966DBF0